MANLYYADDQRGDTWAAGERIAVTGDEAHHAVRVSRLRVGERILVGDGVGTIAEGIATSAERDRFEVEIESVTHADAGSVRIALAQALAKGDRDDRAVEQTTEFGVDAIIPWEADRSVSRWSGRGGGGEKAAKGREKWARIAREAAKQSIRPSVPEVRELSDIAGLAALAARADTRVLALHPRGERALSDWARGLASALDAGSGTSETSVAEIVVVIGPEGGFADKELDQLEAAGAEILVLGSTVLRTSSAGPAAIAVLNAALGRW